MENCDYLVMCRDAEYKHTQLYKWKKRASVIDMDSSRIHTLVLSLRL